MELNSRRNFAFLIDSAIYLALIIVPMLLGPALPESIAKANVAGIPLAILYMIFRDGLNGQSIGKRVMKVQVVHESSKQPIGFGTAFVRGFLTSLPIIGWIDFALVFFTRESQRFTDRWLKVRLVKTA